MALSPFPPLCHFTPGTTYNFTYGVFDLRTGVSVGSQSLATYTYSTDRKYNLQTLDYGNGDSVQYTYDDQDRVIRQTYENGDYISYFYNNDGDIAKVYDSQTGITTTYTYDLSGRLVEYRETGEDHDFSLAYTYNKKNQVTNVMEIVDGHDRESTYKYDADGRAIFAEKVLARREYNYDAFGRLRSTATLGQNFAEVYHTSYSFSDTGSTVSGQVASEYHSSDEYSETYYYTYDDNGNILSARSGITIVSYVYDSANQLIRENNPAWGGYTYTWTYDAAGNITSRKEYGYTTGSLEDKTPQKEVIYDYTDDQWGDLLTEYDGKAITYDQIGNPLSDGEWTYTWKHGRQLASMSTGDTADDTTWDYTYGANGLRTNRTDGTTNYRYVYEGDKLTFMARNGLFLRFAYTPEGAPLSVLYKGTTYYYVTNIQGDVIAILSQNGYVMVKYAYDAWGNLISTTGPLKDSLGQYNPLRYRGYVYDVETELYYLQSRYYDPEWGRFINADSYVATGQGFVGNNMFAYCGNNPTNRTDLTGKNWLSNLWNGFLNGVKDWLGSKKEKAATNADITTTVGATASGAFGAGGSASLGVTKDTKGNVGISFTISGGGGFPSASGGVFASANNAPTIYEQSGLGTTVGASGGPWTVAVGGEYNTLINKEEDCVYHGGTFSATIGLYPTIVEIHGEVGYTWVWGYNMYDVAIGIVDFMLKR